ncbi:probable LRR receptor-like serine/threonine-protein kinase At3g47570 [Quercus lobata]|uniref:probable LRR receptor-like serine/threonine-protein kinase At3g47570 n=1 Tax=Quercus lobata TaxID=97700 RepID=UPI0012450F01|nr:probable LRR receptor-like serine/threonine-protein kinase At3g47570 [Quercus lobata]
MKLHNPNFPTLCSTFLHIILLFTITLLCLQSATSSAAPTNETDYLALLKFKESTDTNPNGILNSWNDSIHFCNWHGITCSRLHQRVKALELQGYNLHGTITPYIGNLTFLRAINLQNNSLYGEIPKEVGHLFRLQHLNLSNNSLRGEIPASLSNCTELRVLTILWNKLIGKIPMELGSLTKLSALGVAANNLTGGIPPSLGNLSGTLPANLGLTLPNLIQFTIGANEFFGPIPSSLCNASRLQTLELGNNSFSGSVPKKYEKKSSSIVSNMDLLPTISYKMLHRATNGFSLNNLIGSGSFGSVYKGVLNQEEMLVAIKVLNLQTKGATKSFVAECNVLRNVRHRNLVKILTCCSSINYNGDEFKALIFEFMTNGNLDMWLHPRTDCENQSKNLSFLQRIIIAIDVASALNYIHNHCQQQIIHCDLKPSNILLDSEMIAHVSDFGLARLLTSTNDSSQKCTSTIGLKGSIGYVAPEYGMGSEPSTEGDVYSYGVLVLEMFTGRMPTDDMFKDGLNLHNFVKMALPKRLAQVVDPMLLPREVEELEAATTVMMAIEKDDNDNEIEVEEANYIEDSKHIDVDMQKCLLSILNIGILCSLESPKERMSMEEVIKELQLIKSAFVSLGIRRGKPSRAQQSVCISEKSCLVETKNDKLVDEEFLAVCLTSGKDDGHPNRRLADFVLHDENGVLQLLEMLEFDDMFIFGLILPLKEGSDKEKEK